MEYYDPITMERKMIEKTHWTQLDDCNKGSFYHQIDWSGCWQDNQQLLIKEYGIQFTEHYKLDWSPKMARRDDGKIIDRCQFISGIIIYILLMTGMYILEGVVGLALFLPMIMVAGVLGLIIGGVAGFIIVTFLDSRAAKKRAKVNAKNDFENWIEGCRK